MNIAQHIRDSLLFKNILKCLGCGYIVERPQHFRVDLMVANFRDILNILIPIFEKYPLQGFKRLDYMDFCEIPRGPPAAVAGGPWLIESFVAEGRGPRMTRPSSKRGRAARALEKNI
jgi:hypothetical protein